MGIRVRKLARELKTSPERVLSLLQQLGYARYRSPEDMVSDVVAGKIRAASRSSDQPPRAPDPARFPPPTASPRQSPRGTPGDVMASLVPGVVRTPTSEPGLRTGAQPAPALVAEQLAVDRRQLAEAQQQLASDRQQLAKAQQQLAADQQRLAEAQQQLTEAQEQLAADQQQLAEARLARAQQPEGAQPLAEQGAGTAEAEPRPERGAALLDLLYERGLRGIDEAERALGVLAGTRSLGRLLEGVWVRESEGLARVLEDRLVLVGGALPEALELPAVIVSADRGDLPGGDTLVRRCRAVGEQLMLLGLTRVVLIGVAPRWHALLRAGIDPRVHLLFRSTVKELTREEADAVVIWGSELVPEAAQQALAEARLQVFAIDGKDLGAWMDAVALALAEVG